MAPSNAPAPAKISAATREPITGIGTPTNTPVIAPTTEPMSARTAPRRVPPTLFTPLALAPTSTTSPRIPSAVTTTTTHQRMVPVSGPEVSHAYKTVAATINQFPGN